MLLVRLINGGTESSAGSKTEPISFPLIATSIDIVKVLPIAPHFAFSQCGAVTLPLLLLFEAKCGDT